MASCELSGKVAIVTGAGRNIGRAIALALADAGAAILVNARESRVEADSVAAEIAAAGGQAQAHIGNVADEKAVRAMADAALAQFGRIDILVNNAALRREKPFAEMDYREWREILDVTLDGAFHAVKACLPALKQSGEGAIVNIGSKTAETGQGNTSAYAAANGGRNALTREWAVELLPYGIRVNAIIVAECWTPLYENWIKTLPNPEEKLKSIISKIPLEQRMTTAEEIANMAAFLLSEKSSHTTGQLIHVDGGYVHLDRAIS